MQAKTNQIQFKFMILVGLLFIYTSLITPSLSSAAPDVSRRSFLGMLGAALGTAAVGPQVTFLADKVMVTNISEAQKLMQIRSSLDFDFIRRSAWERYLTGKVTINPMSGELGALEGYRAKLLEFMSNPSVSHESRQLANILFKETNNFHPFDISVEDYVKKAKRYFEEERARTVDLRIEEISKNIEGNIERVYQGAQEDYELRFEEIELEVSLNRCKGFLK